jgi:UDP-2-acetamido-3-amino-2,3-dideoxy-glucuronate N-acetyltransferase
MIDPAASVDPTAEIAANASVGPGAAVGAGARVGSGARIGSGSIVGRDVLVDDGVEIGDRSVIHDGALLYRGAVVEEGVFVGPRAILTSERYPRAVTSTAELEAAADATPEALVVRAGSSIGAGAVLVSGIEVGAFASVGAGAVVTSTVAGHALVGGNPAHRVGWVCSCGLPLVDAEGSPAVAEPAHYSRHPELRCPSCGRVYVYVPDGDALEEREQQRAERVS